MHRGGAQASNERGGEERYSRSSLVVQHVKDPALVTAELGFHLCPENSHVPWCRKEGRKEEEKKEGKKEEGREGRRKKSNSKDECSTIFAFKEPVVPQEERDRHQSHLDKTAGPGIKSSLRDQGVEAGVAQKRWKLRETLRRGL